MLAINWDNANKAGLFTEQDVVVLERDCQRQWEAQWNAKPERPTADRITIQNATKEQIQNALHKALVKGKK
jgi:hypothetical protein